MALNQKIMLTNIGVDVVKGEHIFTVFLLLKTPHILIIEHIETQRNQVGND